MKLTKRSLTSSAFSLVALASLTTISYAGPKVVTSIKPVHSLVSAVMQGIGKPELIVSGVASPHSFALKPSQAQALSDADLIVWIGSELETFLEKPIETIGSNANVMTLFDTEGLNKLKFREDSAFEAHDHGDEHEGEHADHDDDHDHDEEHADHDGDHDHDEEHADHDDDHDHDEEHADHDDDHDHDEEHAGHDDDDDHDEEHAGHDDGHHHAHDGEFDAHIWLDPVNAKLFAGVIGDALSKIDPENAANYAKNVSATQARLDTLVADVNARIAPARGKGFIVFHDAYQYFEKRFDIEAAGSLTINPEVKPSAERLASIRDKVRDLNTVCAFTEPQFDSRLVSVAIEGTDAHTGTLDPLGAALEDGPDLYFNLIDTMAQSMLDCLSPKT